VLQNAGYAFVGQRLIRERTIGDAVADNAVVQSLHSLRNVARAFSGYAAGYAVLYVALVVWGSYSAEVDTVWLVLVALFLQGVGYSAMDQPETFAHSLGVGETQRGDDDERSSKKYAKPALAPERARRIWEDLLRLFRDERLHLNRELKLSDVARRLNVSPHNLSQAISVEGEASFLELVNRHRIDEAKRMLADPKTSHLTILAIGFEAGFNNKASFNQAFKRFAECTPSVFRRERAASEHAEPRRQAS
jgi:AraC-like DNA-binding protein